MSYIVWGKIHNSDVLIKLHMETKRNKAVTWMNNNRKYYDDMRVYEFHYENNKRKATY